MRIELFRSLALLPLFWLAVSACPSAGTQARPIVPVSDIPAEMQAEYDVFATNCSKCHSLARALNAPVTDVKHWDLYVARMMRTAGSSISPSEAPHILRFLYWYTREHAAEGARSAGEDMGGMAPSPAPEASAAPATEALAPTPTAPVNPNGQEATQAPGSSEPAATPVPSAEATTPVGEGKP